MSSYVYEYRGTYGVPMPSEGMDPNYRDGYHGERMEGGPRLAAYGEYRERHLDDLGPQPHAPALPPGEEMPPTRLENA
jgi:hypothetical protein